MSASFIFDASHKIDAMQAAAARRFYVDVLGGREVRRDTTDAGRRERILFVVGHSIIETGPAFRGGQSPIVLSVDDVERCAARCWDAGFTVQLPSNAVGLVPVAVVDPFGRCIELVARTP